MRFGTAIKKAIELVLVFALVSAAGSSPAWATWVVQTSGTTNILRGVHFPVDATTGYAVGDSATLLKTTDGGANWIAQTSGTTNPLRDVHFPVDAITGYAVGGSGTLMKTTDGGANWVAQTSGTANNLHDVHFPVDAITGYAVGNSGTLLKTTNGGANWVAQTSGTTNILRGVHFPVDATTGYAVGNSGTLLKTTDGGANWVAQTSGTAKNLLGVHFPVDATTGYAVGNSGTLLKTTDGGANWVAQTSGTAKSLNGVCFPVDASSGYVVGGSGIILTTTDGGANWVAQTSGTANNLHDVHFPVDANTGYAVGGNGTILLGFYIAIDGDFSEWDDGIGNEFCIVDQCGADDWTNPDRLDITKMCIASNQQDTIYNLLAVDDVTLSGQIITSCMLIDTDDPSNGFADFVQCMTLEGSGPTTVQRVELFTCNDTATDGCPGASSIKTYTPSDWGFSNTEIGPFGNADSFLELEFPYSDLNVSGGQVLFSSYISFPGRAFLTSPKDSIFCDGGEQDYEARIDYDLDNGTATTVPVTLAYFRSAGSGNVSFEWATATETGNLGFHLYVLAEDGLRRLNKKLIPSRIGDALTPQRYSLEAWGVAGDLFVLEDVDLYGQTRYHGPFELGQTYGRKVWDVPRTDWAGIRREHDHKSVARRPRPALARGSSLGRSSDPGRAAAVHLRVREDGIYRVTYEALLAAGVDLGGVPVAHLALLESGRSVPISVEGRGPFGPGSFIEFVGRGLDTLYTDTNVYTLIRSPKRAARVVRPKLRMPPSMETPAFYYETRTVEANRAYDFAAPGDDPWYDTRLLAISEPVEAVYELELDDRLPGQDRSS